VVSAERGVVLGALLVAGCIRVNPADGAFVCGTTVKCPDGYYCAGNNTCWHNGHPTSLGMVNQACNQPSDCSTSSCLKGFCQLVSDSPKWIATGVSPLPGPRAQSAGFVTSGGLLMSVSGAIAADNTPTDAVMDYKIGTGNVKGYAAIPHARFGHTGAMGPDGRFYVTGGTTTTMDPTALVDAFDYAANAWNASGAPAALNVARRHAASAYAGGKLWVFGGFDGSKVLGSIEVYNPGSPDGWTTIAAVLPTPRTSLAAVTGIDDRVYTIGGGDSTHTAAPSLEIFDPKTMTWSTGANMSMGRGLSGAVAAPDGRIYTIGGFGDAQSAAPPPLPTVEAYTPATNTWVPVAKLNVPRFGGVALVGPDNRIYFMGGGVAAGGDMGTAASPSATVEVYGPAMAVAPGTGTAGETNVSIAGSNFAADTVVDVFFGDRASAPVASGNTDADGNISAPITFIIPANATSGVAKVFAVDRKSQYPSVTTFAVQ
jgi:hypothetical protein